MLLLYSVKANHTFGLASDQLIRKPNSQVGFSEQGQLAQRFSLIIKTIVFVFINAICYLSAKQVFWLLDFLFQNWR